MSSKSVKLLHPADVDVPSMVVLESSYERVAKHIAMSDYFFVWRAFCRVVLDVMLKGRGCRVTGLGLFGYTSSSSPGFFLDDKFCQETGTEQKGKANMSVEAMNGKVNFASVADEAKVPSRLAMKVVESALETFKDFVRQGCTVCVSLQPLGFLTCDGRYVTFKFGGEFEERLKDVLNGVKRPTRAVKNLQARRAKIPGMEIAVTKEGEEKDAEKRLGTPSSTDADAGANFLGSDSWPPKVTADEEESSGRKRAGLDKGRGNRDNGNIMSHVPPTPPTPRLTKSAQLRLKADRMKEATKMFKGQDVKRKGAREMASAARMAELKATVNVVRNKISVRAGVYGVRGMGRNLRSMDYDGNGELSKREMNNGFIDLGVKLSKQQVEDLFVYFDSDGSGAVSFEEFMEGLRGETNERRVKVVNWAFDVVDESQNEEVTVSEMKKRFNCRGHPSVVEGTATKEQVLKEFIGQWDKAVKGGVIGREEFVAFYRDIGSAIIEDNDFEGMIENTWRFSIEDCDRREAEEEERLERGGGEEEQERHRGIDEDPYADDIKVVSELIFSPVCNLDDFIVRVGASQVSARPTLTTIQFMSLLKVSSKGKMAVTKATELTDSVIQSVEKGAGVIDIQKLHSLLSLRFGEGGGGREGGIIHAVKAKLLQRAGSDGLRAVSRVMTMMDDDGSKTLTKDELKFGLADWGLQLNIAEVDAIFGFFDRDNSGSISFDEFLKGMRGPMSER